MSGERKEAGSVIAIISSLAAATAVTSGFLFYIGYLFLRGFYRAFNIPIELLEFTPQDVIAESGTLLVPLLLFVALYVLLIRMIGRSAVIGLQTLFWSWKSPMAIASIAFILVLTLTIPPTGEWFAKRLLSQRFTAYNFLAKPLPSVRLFAKEPLFALTPDTVTNEMHVYNHLILVAANKEYYFLHKKDSGTYVIPKKDVSVILSSSAP
jgi:hypothetical protein